ncbi:MAG: 6-aminohexanoate-cyclic-dimer hydrolase [Cryobacterium sp.]|nr:6-aminohexanoate-cyclic-dimer hydrolase [Cryobacterium sp.]
MPFLIKDSGPFAQGVRFALGSRSIQGVAAEVDHEMMVRFRAAGLVAIGQSTAPEFGLNFATEPVRTGPTRNPWDLGRGVGGSSGGAAALVAAGAVPLAHANDAAGSIRVPAACCGLVGLKPSRGRTPNGPLAGEAAFGLIGEFALTRSVRDAAHLLDAVGAPSVGEKYTLPAPATSFARTIQQDPGRLRVALMRRAWSGVPVDAQMAAAAEAVARTLEWIGHAVLEDAPVLDPEDILEAEMLGVFATGTALLRAPRRPDPTRLEAVSRAVLAETANASALDVAAAIDAQHRVTRSIGVFLGRYNLLVTPTLAQLPPRHGTLDYNAPGHTARSWIGRILEFGPFTAPFNISGHPAISLPLGPSREGLPVGVQLVAAYGRDDLLLQVAGRPAGAGDALGRPAAADPRRPGLSAFRTATVTPPDNWSRCAGHNCPKREQL